VSKDEAQQTEEVAAKRRRMRSIAIALALVGMALMFYLATLVHLGGNVANRPL